MNEETALKIIEEKLLGINSIPVTVRMGHGINESDYTELKSAINFLIGHYKNETKIPKIVALAFLDISNHFFLGQSPYSQKENERIEDIGIKIAELGDTLFSNESL